MHVVSRKHLTEAAEQYKDAAKEIAAWYKIAAAARWRNFVDVQTSIQGCGRESIGRVIFNIRHNRYRLVTIIHYSREKNGHTTEGRIYIRSFLTHSEYDNKANWDKGLKQ